MASNSPLEELCPFCGRWVESLHQRTGWCVRCTARSIGRAAKLCPDCGREHVVDSSGHSLCSRCREKRYAHTLNRQGRPSGGYRRCPLCLGWRKQTQPLCADCEPRLPAWREATAHARRLAALHLWTPHKQRQWAIARVLGHEGLDGAPAA